MILIIITVIIYRRLTMTDLDRLQVLGSSLSHSMSPSFVFWIPDIYPVFFFDIILCLPSHHKRRYIQDATSMQNFFQCCNITTTRLTTTTTTTTTTADNNNNIQYALHTGFDQHNCSTVRQARLVLKWVTIMWASKQSPYVTSHPSPLSLASPQWVSAVCTSKRWGYRQYTTRCTSPVSVISQWVHHPLARERLYLLCF